MKRAKNRVTFGVRITSPTGAVLSEHWLDLNAERADVALIHRGVPHHVAGMSLERWCDEMLKSLAAGGTDGE